MWAAKRMGPRQAKWNNATEARVSATSSVLTSIKSLRLMGFTKYAVSDLKGLRKTEIQESKAFRKFTVFMNVLGLDSATP
jgi:ATP-binding cassette subfamily C (CFTR/MRP) protein 1